MEWSGTAEFSPQRSRRFRSAVLDIGRWCNWSTRRGCRRRKEDEGGEAEFFAPPGRRRREEGEGGEEEFFAPPSRRRVRRRATAWRVLSRRLLTEKRRMFSSGVGKVRMAYDPRSYAQNFEEPGAAMAWVDEEEERCRSFSARFAVPSRVFSGAGGSTDDPAEEDGEKNLPAVM
ncbi:unnamed protein product [Spirodela intermedia]|uniref:Uncharacterized protein n=2 Tax=Spirodela intermedia TaxID=51605 RepID=A0A7I8J7T5_SPIIN|nr:unnamed protein product [Spirodela intermedia]CAA6666257.1 unnamed protein product [Spirodela intermedia]CAA7403033.1 unnamed protein product [Spirodela intermedia]